MEHCGDGSKPFPKPKVTGSSPVGTAKLIRQSFSLNHLAVGLTLGAPRFDTTVFTL